MPRNLTFYNYIKLWIKICQIMGFFPYQKIKSNFVRNRFHYLDVFRCLLLYLGNEIYFSGFKSKYNYFGWILVGVDFFFTLIWITLCIINNHRLITLFKTFDAFDDSFNRITKSIFKQKSFVKNKTVILVSVLFIMDYFNMFCCVIYLKRPVTYSAIVSISRALQRSVMALFLIGYLYLLHCIEIRFYTLQEVWILKVENKAGKIFKQFEIMKNMDDIKFLYMQLIGIMESLNSCFGSRLVVMFAQLFYLILLYFYMICTGLPAVASLLPFYLSVIFIVTLKSRGLYRSIKIEPRMLKLPSTELSENFLIQWYGFIQQLRMYSVHINAAGFFTVNQRLLGSLTMAIASYLVAIFQLAPLMDNIGKKTVISII